MEGGGGSQICGPSTQQKLKTPPQIHHSPAIVVGLCNNWGKWFLLRESGRGGGGSEEEGGGQIFVYQKRPNKVFAMVNFVFSPTVVTFVWAGGGPGGVPPAPPTVYGHSNTSLGEGGGGLSCHRGPSFSIPLLRAFVAVFSAPICGGGGLRVTDPANLPTSRVLDAAPTPHPLRRWGRAHRSTTGPTQSRGLWPRGAVESAVFSCTSKTRPAPNQTTAAPRNNAQDKEVEGRRPKMEVCRLDRPM